MLLVSHRQDEIESYQNRKRAKSLLIELAEHKYENG